MVLLSKEDEEGERRRKEEILNRVSLFIIAILTIHYQLSLSYSLSLRLSLSGLPMVDGWEGGLPYNILLTG